MGGEIRVDSACVRGLARDATDVVNGLRLGPVLEAAERVAQALPDAQLGAALASCMEDLRGSLVALVTACESWQSEVAGAVGEQLETDDAVTAHIARMLA